MSKTKELTPLQAAQQKYNGTSKGKARFLKYDESEKGQQRKAKYDAKRPSRAEEKRTYRAKKKLLAQQLTILSVPTTI